MCRDLACLHLRQFLQKKRDSGKDLREEGKKREKGYSYNSLCSGMIARRCRWITWRGSPLHLPPPLPHHPPLNQTDQALQLLLLWCFSLLFICLAAKSWRLNNTTNYLIRSRTFLNGGRKWGSHWGLRATLRLTRVYGHRWEIPL